MRAGGPLTPTRTQLATAVLAFVAVTVAAPFALSAFWVSVLIGATTTTTLAIGVGMLYGRVGLVSLSHVGLFAIGIWVTMRLGFATALPYPVLMLVSGVVTMCFGVAIGAPALRLSGIYLALMTLFAAQAIAIVLGEIQFPNGGDGFSGLASDLSDVRPARRPSFAQGDVAYLRFAAVVAVLMFVLTWVHVRTRPGRAWAAIRQSEASAEVSGVDITVHKLWAFALSSFVAGVAGSVSAGHLGTANPTTYNAVANVVLFAVVLITGAASLWGAVGAGILKEVVPQFFDSTIHISDRWSYILFGAGVLVSLIVSSRAERRRGDVS